MAKLALPPIKAVRPLDVNDDGVVRRDPAHETHLVETAALAVGLARTDTEGLVHLDASAQNLNQMALRRALPGGVRTRGRSLPEEALEELADCRSYLVWHIQLFLDRAIEGDTAAAYEYQRGMRALAEVLQANHALTEPEPA